jgi:hypothetical protein
VLIYEREQFLDEELMRDENGDLSPYVLNKENWGKSSYSLDIKSMEVKPEEEI